jgi:hypothetical protein
MSSTIDSGHAADKASKEADTPCKKSSNRKHKWKQMGSWPSSWDKCAYCGKTIFWK